MSYFHSLTVTAVERLTPNAVALTFDIPEHLKEDYSFTAGQYITIKHIHEGKELRRAYSISSAPTTTNITVGIKKVQGGSFSVYANDNIKEGDVLEVMVPEGRFTFSPDEKAQHIAAFAAGSGITPVLSIAKTVLESHPENTFTLVYGNQSVEETMFKTALLTLASTYANRFFIQFVYSRAQEEEALFGRIDSSTVNYIIKNKFKETSFNDFYICGPETMINEVEGALKNAGVAEANIHFELFTTSDAKDDLAEELDGKTQIEVVVDDETFSFVMDKKALVLDAVLKEDIDAPYSCQGGVCSSCIARITEGKAEMVQNQILTDSEIEEGLILTCQAHPTTPTLKIDYDDV